MRLKTRESRWPGRRRRRCSQSYHNANLHFELLAAALALWSIGF
jgi:hypothetical protein